MNVAYIYVNIIALIFFFLLFVAFMAAEKSREMNAWLVLLGAMVLWALGALFMRVEVFPGIDFWFYESLLALFSIPYLLFKYVYILTDRKSAALRWVWLAGTAVFMVLGAEGIFLAPPVMSSNASGDAVVKYCIDWKISIPITFFVCELIAVAVLIKQYILEKGSGATGIRALIIGCAILVVGNLAQVLPGNTFPFDALSGILFATHISTSMYKRRLFDTTQLISSSFLLIFSVGLFVAAGVYFFPILNGLLLKHGEDVAFSEMETFAILAIGLIVSVAAFRKVLEVIFSRQENQNRLIKNYSDTVSKTLDIDRIVEETEKVIHRELKVKSTHVCLLQDDSFVPADGMTVVSVSKNSPIVRYFEKGESYALLKDFEADSVDKTETQPLDDCGIACICALKDGNSVLGLMLLSEKEKSAEYEFSDFSYMNTVSSIASIAIKNALLYKQVAEREHLFSSMTGFIPNVILIKPANGDEFCFVSANTERVLGLGAEYFNGKNAIEALTEFAGEAKAKEIIRELENNGESGYSCDLPFVTRTDRRNVTLRCAFLPIYTDREITHYVCVISDISEDIEARNLLKASVELAQNSDRAKGEFLSHMSHEIRTPMNSIAGLTYLAKELAGRDTQPELYGYLDQIDKSSQYLINMLNNIMDMSKLESSKYELACEEFDVRAVVDELCAIFGSQLEAKNVRFDLDINALDKSKVTGDEIALRKILNNLLSNAYKFTPEGGRVSLTVSRIAKNAKTDVIKIVVSDTGIGISPDFIDRLFTPYSQERGGNGSQYGGSGLGMAICKSMVDLQGGTISVESKVGEGTTLTVEIPYPVADRITENAENADFAELDGKCIMVVDDVKINTVITKRLLEKKNASVDCAENGKQALELFESKADGHYACILMDIQMPVMDGIEAAAEIRRAGKNYAKSVPIVAMSADAFLKENRNNMNDFNGYILKPVSPEGLYGKLAAVLQGRNEAEI